MSNVILFTFETEAVRIITRDGQPWFVLGDVCRVLEIGNPSDAARRLDDNEKGVDIIDTLGGSQEATVVNESGLYSLILTSRKPAAKRFKKWVTAEVLPMIRKTGAYAVGAHPEDGLLDDERLWHARIRLAMDVLGRNAARWLWRQSPLPTPPLDTVRQREVRETADGGIADFIGFATYQDDRASVKASTLYHAYRRWCIDEEVTPATMTRFGRDVRKLGIAAARSGTVRYLGIGLYDFATADPVANAVGSSVVPMVPAAR